MPGTSSYYQLFSIMLPQDILLRAEFFRFLSRCIHIGTYAGLMLQSSLCQHVKDRLEMMNDG